MRCCAGLKTAECTALLDFPIKVYHFDLYRVRTVDSFIELGFDEYLNDPNGLCLIEWPKVIESLATSSWVKVVIDYDGIEKRKITITTPDE